MSRQGKLGSQTTEVSDIELELQIGATIINFTVLALTTGLCIFKMLHRNLYWTGNFQRAA